MKITGKFLIISALAVLLAVSGCSSPENETNKFDDIPGISEEDENTPNTPSNPNTPNTPSTPDIPSIIAVTGVSLNKQETYIVVGGEEPLYVNIEPSTATNTTVTWNSSDESIATVSENGVVTAVKAGTATITVTTDDGGYKDECTVTVSNYAVSVKGISINEPPDSLVVYSTETLSVTITPYNATHQIITWRSSDDNIVTVSEGGVITAKNVGTATITITTDDGGYHAECTVTVKPKVITFTVGTIEAQTYTVNAIEPTVTVKDDTTPLTLGIDYTLSYSNNINLGTNTASVTITGKGNYEGSNGSATFTIKPKAITFTIDSIADQTYTNSVITPAVTVKDDTTILNDTNYTVTCTNNINLGTATVNITGKGNYEGSKGIASFTIKIPVFTSILEFGLWLGTQATNTSSNPYYVKVNVSDLGGDYNTYGSLGYTLRQNSTKYVNLFLESITSIPNSTFCYCTGLASVTIPNSVTYIGDYAFQNCIRLTEINFYANPIFDVFLSLPSRFNGAGRASIGITVNIGANVTRIPSGLFSGANITAINFVSGSVCKSINVYAFRDCTGLKSITIPNSVTSIGEGAFTNCTGLTSITFATGSNISDENFGSGAFPEGSTGTGGDKLKNAYNTANPKAGTYTREVNGSMWTKQ